MRIQKVIEDNVSLSTRDLTSGNIHQAIVNKLKAKYEGKCWDNAYIVEIVEILRKSSIKMARDRLEGQGDANVQFKVNAINYPEGDVLVGCRIDSIKRHNLIICEYENAVVVIGDDFFISPKNNQLITVQIETASYLTNKDEVMVYAKPYAVKMVSVIYKVLAVSSFTDDMKKMLRVSLDRVNSARTIVEAAKKADIKFFTDIMYPYTENVDTVIGKIGSTGLKLVDMEKLANEIISGKVKGMSGSYGDSLIYMKHPAINMTTPKIYELTSGWEASMQKIASFTVKDKSEGTKEFRVKPDKVFDKTFIDLIVDTLNEYSIYLNMIANMARVYARTEIRDKHN
jgi:hypothetical protein